MEGGDSPGIKCLYSERVNNGKHYINGSCTGDFIDSYPWQLKINLDTEPEPIR